MYVLPYRNSISFSAEQITKLLELQRTLHISDENTTVIKCVEIMYRLYTNPKLGQLQDVAQLTDKLSTLEKIIESTYEHTYVTEDKLAK